MSLPLSAFNSFVRLHAPVFSAKPPLSPFWPRNDPFETMSSTSCRLLSTQRPLSPLSLDGLTTRALGNETLLPYLCRICSLRQSFTSPFAKSLAILFVLAFRVFFPHAAGAGPSLLASASMYSFPLKIGNLFPAVLFCCYFFAQTSTPSAGSLFWIDGIPNKGIAS